LRKIPDADNIPPRHGIALNRGGKLQMDEKEKSEAKVIGASLTPLLDSISEPADLRKLNLNELKWPTCKMDRRPSMRTRWGRKAAQLLLRAVLPRYARYPSSVERSWLPKFFAFIFFSTALYQLAAAENDSPTFHVGVVLSLSGIAAEDGQNMLHAYELAAEHVAEQGKIKVELFVEDDQTDPQKAVTAFEKLHRDNVDVVFGSAWSFVTAPLVPLSAQRKLPLINTSNFPGTFNLDASDGYAAVYYPTVSDELAPFRAYLDRQSPKRIAILTANTPWGAFQRQESLKIAAERKIEVTEDLTTPVPDNNDWATIVAKLKTNQPDMVVIWLCLNDVNLFMRKAAELHYRPTVFSSMMAYDAFQKMPSKNDLEGICFTYPYDQLRSRKNFFEAFVKKYGTEPRIYSDTSYDGLTQASNAYLKSVDSKSNVRETLIANVGAIHDRPSTLLCIRHGKIAREQ